MQCSRKMREVQRQLSFHGTSQRQTCHGRYEAWQQARNGLHFGLPQAPHQGSVL